MDGFNLTFISRRLLMGKTMQETVLQKTDEIKLIFVWFASCYKICIPLVKQDVTLITMRIP